MRLANFGTRISSIALGAMITLTPALVWANEPVEGGGTKPSVFDGTVTQSIAAILVFLILFAILSKFAWGPILKGLQDRENKIKSDLEHAEHAAQQAAATLREYQAKLAAAQEEARKIITQGRVDAEKIAANLKEQTQTEIDAIKKRAESDIRGAKEAALNEIYSQVANVATDMAGRILQRQLQPADQQRLLDESLAAVSKAQRN